ncbi:MULTISPECIES: EAL domain-containing protein [unclassified Thioalkalivibrio]|uniref:EAL domain-containing protein n=1 Tax=unclassified Thioalkalivibrio TaxID=2621013 RepID=UPI000195A4B1|nr:MULTISPECIES: EAL domain-containing protein [unclassified Thioalkalivibrio]ADC72090.1 response regulator receiver modulated diguanylate cyclase/phosphodiesterase with PAS/PAC sensor(s) [Thioalkalivibrio sp. K90mix]
MNEPGTPQTPRILVVDDDPRLLESVRQLLELQTFNVETAPGGGSAIEALRRDPPDLLLLDLCMPELGGRDVLRFIQAAGLAVPVVVISGNTSVDDVAGALRDGASDYLKKPYQPDELLATVRNALHKKDLEDANRHMRARLERSERLHRLIVNNSPDIVFILDRDGRFRFVNSRVHELLGYSRQDLLDTRVLDLVETDDHEKAEYFFEQAGRSHAHIRSVELALKPREMARTRRYFEVAVWPTAASDDTGETLVYGTARDITDRKESEAFINFQAYHDLLTRLPNRALFRDRVDVAIAQAQRQGHPLAVMFIDLNRFKVINDSLGHTIGDRLLQAVAQRLLGCIRKGDTLSRFGGDEFTLLLPQISRQEAAVDVAEKILESLNEPFHLGGDHELYVGASIGIAIYPEGGDTLETLIRHADIAMYREKNTGKNGIRLFAPEMHGNTPHRLQLEQDLRKALEREEFHILYQPQVDGETGQLLGVEALVRWNHPDRGMLGPAEFIPVAEDTRLIVDLDRATLRNALGDIRKAHQHVPNLRLAVNLSPVLIERDDFVDGVLGLLVETGFPAELLEIEITESLLMSDTHDTVAKLNRLCEAGVQVAVDDFGTGYSSLSYLQKLPVHTLKIDRSFTLTICTDGEACIVNAIVSMARGLQMNIVAEGVETAAQQEYLRRLGCPMMQGFLFGHPSPLADLLQAESDFGRRTARS